MKTKYHPTASATPPRSYVKRITRELVVLRWMRRSRRISMRRAGAEIGISSSTISHIEQGRMSLPESRIPQLLALYGYTPAEYEQFVMGSSLVKGVLVLIGIAITLGQYPRLERWARSQALEAVEWKQGLPYFFEAPHTEVKHHSIHHKIQTPEGGPK